MYHRAAASQGNVLLLKHMTKRQCRQQDDLGQTPLHKAASIGNIESLMTLLSRGGKIDQPDYYGATCLHIAACRGQLLVVKYLVEFGANLVALDNNQRSPMDEAFIANHNDIVEYLDQAISSKTSNAIKQLQRKAMKAHTKSLKDKLKRDHKGVGEIFKPIRSSKSSESLLTAQRTNRVMRVKSAIPKAKSVDDLTSAPTSPETDRFGETSKSHPSTVRFKPGESYDGPISVRKHEGLLHRQGFGELCSAYRPHYVKHQRYAASRGRNMESAYKSASADDLTIIRVLSSEESISSGSQYSDYAIPENVREFLHLHDLSSLEFIFERERITLNELKYVERADLMYSGISEQVTDKFFKAVAIHQMQIMNSSDVDDGDESSLDALSMIIHDDSNSSTNKSETNTKEERISQHSSTETKIESTNNNNISVRFKSVVEEIWPPSMYINERDETTRL